ncbi:MAG: hypothetical protein ABEJ31_01960 [Haloarculaceae archaeon]
MCDRCERQLDDGIEGSTALAAADHVQASDREGGESVTHSRERVADRELTPLPERGNVLLLAPSIGRSERAACMDLCSRHALDRTKLVHVLFMESAAERYRAVERRLRGHPAESAVLVVGSGGGVGARGPEPPADSYHVHQVTDPADLTGLGMALNRCLAEWADPDVQLALCFDSLSILLQYADLERVFRFLHMITGRLAEVAATSHFHLDPAAHDAQTIAQLSQVFDSRVEVDDAGERTVHR